MIGDYGIEFKYSLAYDKQGSILLYIEEPGVEVFVQLGKGNPYLTRHSISVDKKDVLEDFIGIEHNEEILPSVEQFHYVGTQNHVDRMFDMNWEALKERRKNKG